MRYAGVTREELWSGGRLIESRLSFGEAFLDAGRLVASDVCDGSLLQECERRAGALRKHLSSCAGFEVRLLAEATTEDALSLLVVQGAGCTVVSEPESLTADLRILREAEAARDGGLTLDPRGTPIVWRHGSAAVLLHEAAGHPAEQGHPVIAWPAWLGVRDGESDLLAGESPAALRRATFRDVPLRRMREVHVVAETGAPWRLPPRRIEVLLVEGGFYEPLTEEVSVAVAAAVLVEENEDRSVTPVAPFVVKATRSAVARGICGADGSPLRYPGVICSREGQEVFVESHAPLLLTEIR